MWHGRLARAPGTLKTKLGCGVEKPRFDVEASFWCRLSLQFSEGRLESLHHKNARAVRLGFSRHQRVAAQAASLAHARDARATFCNARVIRIMSEGNQP